MGLVIRKLVSILFLFHTFEKPAVLEDSTRKLGESFNDLHFKGLQYGCLKSQFAGFLSNRKCRTGFGT